MLSNPHNAVFPLEGANTNTVGSLNPPSVDLLSPVQSRLQAIASCDDFFSRVLGEKANSAEIQAVRAQWLAGDFSLFPTVQVLDANEMGGAFGAYSQSTQTIYLSNKLLDSTHESVDPIFGATGVLIEETFHWLDSLVGDDTPGDEGELARHLIFGVNLNADELNRVKSEQDQGFITVNGQATAVELSGDGAGNTLATARNITLGATTTTFRDWVGSTDSLDFYKFTLTEAGEVRFTLTGLTGDANLGLLDERGQWVTWSWNTGTANESMVHALNAGTYFVGVYSNSNSAHYTLTGSVTALPDGAGNTLGTARNITLGATATTFTDWVGSIDTHDFYRFTLTQAGEVRFTLTGLTGDANLGLLDERGQWVTWSWNTGTANESISRTLNAGTYFVGVYSNSTSAHYTLTGSVTALPDGAGNTLGTARNITLGATATTFTDWVGSIDTHDFYRFTLTQAGEVRFTLTGLTGDANLGLLDERGQWVTWSWNTGTANESITRTLNAGTYFVGVYSNSTSAHYTLTGSVIPQDLAGNTLETARNITLGATTTTFSDWVGSNDTDDFYRFTLNQASVVNFTLNGGANFELLNSNGSRIPVSPSGGTIAQPLEQGTYFVRVFAGQNSDASYTLSASATALPPDHAGNTRDRAREITLDATTRTFSDWVGFGDTDDFYKFTLTQTSNVQVTLNELQGNADLQLLRADGSVIKASTLLGTAADSIGERLESGTYFLRVFSTGGASTNYSLHVSATPSPSVSLLPFIQQGTLQANRFTFNSNHFKSVFIGNGNVDFGRNLFDELVLTGISSQSVTFNWANSNTGGKVFNPGNGNRVFDALSFTFGSNQYEVLMEGIERIHFTDRTINVFELFSSMRPNDPMFKDQWNLHMIGVHHAWRFTTGSNDVLIGVQDSGLGVDASGNIHPDLPSGRTNWWYTNNYRDDFFRNVPGPKYGPKNSSHGTSVQSIIAAASNNGTGMSGINWNSPVFHIDVLDENQGDLRLADATQQMINFARERGQRLVINMSLGSETFGENHHSDLETIVRNNPNTLFVISSGNGGNQGREGISSPAILAKNYANVIAVGSVRDQGSHLGEGRIARASHSQYGDGLTLMAPSEVIAASAMRNSTVTFGNAIFDGTSAAAPHVTGIASLLWSVNSSLTAQQIKEILSTTAVDVGAPGYDKYHGHGVVNADAAVRRAMAMARGMA